MTEPAPRRSQPTLAEIREIGQPHSIRSRRNAEHWTAQVYGRRISPYLTLVALRLGLSANAVTWVMLAVGWLAAAAVATPGWGFAVLAVVLAHLQMVVDSSDGEVARLTRTSGPVGIFIDKLAHYTTEALVALALGVRAAGGWGEVGDHLLWTTVGGLFATVLLLNKVVNDLVVSSRAQGGLPPARDAADVAAPRSGGVARLRRAARFVPFHRMFHAVELCTVVAVAAVADALLGRDDVTRWTLVGLTVAVAVTGVGHVLAIMTSSRLRP
ncbi:CDP-alcohol phosphatidyltransferase family protein [Cellulomonas massiliensis]|uniref:CDP-alcohol phosphatidyltransferase family protein n=1 Tax=Cellulomonas massiliensis TaxID=1465811 RepID=UPI0002EEA296|nr:CDP-alcohol phosphatidyltransferase family protein [Cellulomonas massiliensis]